MAKKKSFFDVLTEAVNYFAENGYTSQKALDYWVSKIRVAALLSLRTPEQTEKDIRKAFGGVYTRLVTNKGVLQKQPNVSAYTLEKLKPKLRMELQRRILASVNLIKLNRDEAVSTTLRRFQGWATAQPIGGSKTVDKVEEKQNIRKALAAMDFNERRVAIDQTHKLTFAINDIVAIEGGAIAAKWRSHWRQQNYDYREDHKERDEKVYVIRGNWAQKKGLMKVGSDGYTDEITQPGEEVYCFLGDTKIPFANGVKKVYRRWFEGKCAIVTTESGASLRGTPNHPILTNKGWVGLGSLQKGDHVVKVTNKLIDSFEKNQDNGCVSTIENLFGSASKFGTFEAFNQRAADFHGDGSKGNVDVVNIARPLMIGVNSNLPKGFDETNLAEPSISFSRIGSLDHSFDALGLPPESIVCSSSPSASLLGSHFAHTEPLTIANSSDNDAIASQKFHDKSTTHSNLLGQNSRSNAGLVSFDKVVRIEWFDFSGHVYNLETANGWYVADTILTHNCRCNYTYIFSLNRLPDEMLTVKGRESLAPKSK